MSVENFHLVEGPYGSFTFRRVRPQDVDKVCRHVKDHFLHDEPISNLLGYSETYGDEFIHMFKYFLSFNMTFWMEDNETGEVAAVRAIFIETESDDFWDTFPRKCRASQIFFDIGEILHKEVDLFELYGVEKMADLFLSSVAPKYRNQGLSKEMYKRTLKFLAAEGIPLVKSVFTSPISRQAAFPLQFEEVCRLYYKDVKDNRGRLAFPSTELDDEVHYAALMARRISVEEPNLLD